MISTVLIFSVMEWEEHKLLLLQKKHPWSLLQVWIYNGSSETVTESAGSKIYNKSNIWLNGPWTFSPQLCAVHSHPPASGWNFNPSSWQNLRSLMKLVSFWHRLVLSPQSMIGFMSGLGKTFHKTSILARFSHSFTIFNVCLGSLSRWNTKLCMRTKLLADSFRFSCRIWRQSSFFTIPCTFLTAVDPLAAKQPYSIILPAPCLTV